VSDKISDVIANLEGKQARKTLVNSFVTQEEYFIEYGKVREQIRIIDAVMNSDLDEAIKTEVRKIIKED